MSIFNSFWSNYQESRQYPRQITENLLDIWRFFVQQIFLVFENWHLNFNKINFFATNVYEINLNVLLACKKDLYKIFLNFFCKKYNA